MGLTCIKCGDVIKEHVKHSKRKRWHCEGCS